MKLTHPFLQKLIAFGCAGLASVYRRTIDWRAVYFDPTTDSVHPQQPSRFIYLTWHESLLMPILLRGSRKNVALASEHRDGRCFARAMKHFGWRVIHGSTSRRAVPALLRLLREERRHISITPDGPLGPRRTMAAGAVFLASRLGLPVVCVGYGYERPWRAKSWDRLAVPRPFSRGRAIFGPPVRVPPNLDRTEIERYRLWFERLLTWLTDEAEQWAMEGRSRPGEAVMAPRYFPHCMEHPCGPSAPSLPPELAAEWESLTQLQTVAA